MKTKQQLQLHDARRYDAPVARTIGCTTEGGAVYERGSVNSPAADYKIDDLGTF